MTRKEQNKILDAKIESNVNQYKVDRMNAEISAFSSGDLNKCEFLKRIDLNYTPNALDKARFEFSPLGRAFSEGLDKTIPNYQEEGVIKLLKEIRDNLAGLPMPPGPPGSTSPPGSPSPPSSPSLTNITTPSSPSLTNITTPSSPSLTNVTPLPPSDSSRKTRTVRSRSKSLQSDSQKVLDQLKLEALQRPRPKSPPVIPLMPTHKTDSDGAIKKIKGQDEKNKLLEEQRKLLRQRNEQDKRLKQQNDEQKKLLEEQKKLAEENMLRNIDSGPFVKFRTSFPKKYIKKPMSSPSKIPAPITKSREPQGVAVGEQAGVAIMENKLETSKNYIEYLKKE